MAEIFDLQLCPLFYSFRNPGSTTVGHLILTYMVVFAEIALEDFRTRVREIISLSSPWTMVESN
jgi:hypothetical protein